jgi:putative transposase
MRGMTRTPYLTDLNDAEWDSIASLFPAPAAHGRPRLHSPREIFNAIVYLLRSGCAWRLLPHDLPPWKTVYHYFRLWQKNGLWERIHSTLRERVRVQMGREAQPTAGIIDSQSVKTIGLPGPRGYDAGKKIKGRKRHLLVDTQGFVLKAKVHAADIMDRDGVKLLVEGVASQFPQLHHVWLDAGYNGKGKGKDWIETTLGWTAKIVQHPPKPRYIWLPKGVEPDWDKIAAQLPPRAFTSSLVDGW